MTKRTLTLLSTAAFLAPVVFDNTGWKKDEAGNLVLDASGNPIYVNTGGKEQTVNPQIIAQLNGEAKNNRERAEAAEAKLKEFDGVDVKAGLAAIEKLKSVDLSKMVDAGKIDEVRAELAKEYGTQLEAKDKVIAEKEQKLDSTLLDAAFSGSKYIKDNIAIPTEMIKATFGKYFQIKDGAIVPVNGDGAPIYSTQDMGRVASFDEALGILVEKYDNKDAILKAADQRGSGNNGDGATDPSGKRTVSRADFDAMNPGDKHKTVDEIRKGNAVIA